MPRDLSWSPQILLSLLLKLSHFSFYVFYSPEFLDFLNDFYSLNSSFSSCTIPEFIDLSVLSHISLGFFQIIIFSFFFFFSLVTDLHLLGVSYGSSIALFWWCHISFIFLMGLCWCLWGEVISSGLLRLASVGKAFPPEVAMRALAGWDAVSLVPEEAQWFRLHATPLADLGQNRGSFMPKATEDR